MSATNAPRCIALLAVAAWATQAACAVRPSATQFQSPEDCPPYFVLTDALPHVDQIDVLSPTDDLDLTVTLQSCALTTSYDARVFVDGGSDIKAEVQIPSSTGITRDDNQIHVPLAGQLSAGCHRVELLASTAFVNGRTPVRADDLAYIVWFVDVNEPGTVDPVSGCNRQ